MHMHMRRSAGIATALAALAVAGCGSDDAGSGSSSTPGTPAATTAKAAQPASTAKGDPIVIGSICSCTGPQASTLGRSLDVMQAWVKDTNAKGGINGHPVKLITADDAQNPAKSLAAVKKMVAVDKVVAIVGQMSLTSATWEKYVASKGIPVVGGQSVDTPFLTNADFYPSGSTLPLQLYGVLASAKEAGKKKVGVLYCAESPICAQLAPITVGLGKLLGLTVVTAKASSTAPSYTAQCLSLKSKGVEAVWAALSSDVVPRIVGSCVQQGYKPLVLASSSTTQRSWTKDSNLDGAAVPGTNAVYTDQSIPGVKRFTDAINTYSPGLSDTDQFSYPLLFPWAGGELFAAAAKAGDVGPTSTAADVKKGLYALKGETLDGIAPPLTFTKDKPAFPTCYFKGEITGGAFKSVGGTKPVCLDPATAGAIGKALAG